MILHTLLMFSIYLFWTALGFVLHIAKKLMEAKNKKADQFKFEVFWDLNKFGYLFSGLILFAACALIAVSPSQIKELPPVDVLGFVALPWQFYLVSFGFSGGSLFKNLLNRKKKNNGTA